MHIEEFQGSNTTLCDTMSGGYMSLNICSEAWNYNAISEYRDKQWIFGDHEVSMQVSQL